MKQYRLLRNNKESGPFEFEDLIKTGLKPYDLLWVEGRSAGWRYPSEIEEFKPYAPAVEEQPYDRFYKRPSATYPARLAEEPARPVEKKPKPRIRITAISNRIEPPQPVIKQEIPQPVSVAPHWKEMYDNWESEKKEQNRPEKVENDLYKTEWVENFPNSFSNLQEPQAEKILTKSGQARSKPNDSNALVFLLGLLIISMGIWIAYSWSKTSSHNPDELKVETVENNRTPAANSAADVHPQESETENFHLAKKDETPSIPSEKNNADERKVSPNTNKSVVSAALKNKPTEKEEPAVTKSIESAAREVKASLPASEPKTETATGQKSNTDFIKAEKAGPKIKDYIHVSATQPVTNSAIGVKYRIENVSEIPVDLIMLDLMYYDANGKYKKGETVYVRNISPGQTVNLPAPDNADAAKIKYRISMISAESQGLYLIAD